jgi:hypothetical protein
VGVLRFRWWDDEENVSTVGGGAMFAGSMNVAQRIIVVQALAPTNLGPEQLYKRIAA